MALPLDLARRLQNETPGAAWRTILDYAWSICAEPITIDSPTKEVMRRERELYPLDLYLATAGYDLWNQMEPCAPRNAKALASWWAKGSPGRAVLILDALSLREIPWILHAAPKLGFTVQSAQVYVSEMPGETTPFRVLAILFLPFLGLDDCTGEDDQVSIQECVLTPRFGNEKAHRIPPAGHVSLEPLPDAQKQARHSYVYVFRGAAGAVMDLFDIAGNTTGAWTATIVYGGSGMTFTTGTCMTPDPYTGGGRFAFINASGLQRCLKFDVKNRVLSPAFFLRYPSGTAAVGQRMATAMFVDGATKLSRFARVDRAPYRLWCLRSSENVDFWTFAGPLSMTPRSLWRR